MIGNLKIIGLLILNSVGLIISLFNVLNLVFLVIKVIMKVNFKVVLELFMWIKLLKNCCVIMFGKVLLVLSVFVF